MNIQTLGKYLREEDPVLLAKEAVWRGVKPIRRWQFRNTLLRDNCPVSFRPIGYYQWQKEHIPERVQEAILEYADLVSRGEYPLMGYGNVKLGIIPDWQRDWVSGKRWSMEPSNTLQTIRHDGSDVKCPWELSRLQFAPVVGKAYALTGDRKYKSVLQALLSDWVLSNPVGMGVNWTLAMEAALRAISLCLTMELLWPFADDEQGWLDLLTESLWKHLLFIEAHNEFSYLTRSNHYLSNIVGLATLAAYLDGPEMSQRRGKYGRKVQQEIQVQTYPDGGDIEASTGYHAMVAQMFLHSFVVQKRCGLKIDEAFERRLNLMLHWISTMTDQAGKLPHIGDCDDGRVELLFDDVRQSMLSVSERHSLRMSSLSGLASYLLDLPFGRDKADAVWFGCRDKSTSEGPSERISLMPDSGIASARSGDAKMIFCAMPNGIGGKGSHTHCDKLSVVFSLGDHEVFSDGGSFCYTRSAELRNLYRSVRAHNTLSVDGEEQNVIPLDPQCLFRSGNEAAVSTIQVCGEYDGEIVLRASHSGYARFNVEHRRTVRLNGALVITDEVNGAEIHSLDLRFLLGPEWHVLPEVVTGAEVRCSIRGPRQLRLDCKAEASLTLTILPAEISRAYGSRLTASCISIHTSVALPTVFITEVRWDKSA
jgi:hypothetical protein